MDDSVSAHQTRSSSFSTGPPLTEHINRHSINADSQMFMNHSHSPVRRHPTSISSHIFFLPKNSTSITSNHDDLHRLFIGLRTRASVAMATSSSTGEPCWVVLFFCFHTCPSFPYAYCLVLF